MPMRTRGRPFFQSDDLPLTPGELVALRAVQRQIPLDTAVYQRLSDLHLIAWSTGPGGWALTSRGELVNPTLFR
jgi:hypothetical protein